MNDINHIFIISLIVFVVLNIIENILHYNNGRTYNKEYNSLYDYINLPSFNDFIEIIIVMSIFAILQGLMTEYFSYYY